MSYSDWISVGGLSIGILSLLGGFFLWYKGSVEKRYAAERDFAHLRRNQEQISNGLAAIDKFLDDRLDEQRGELKEIKALCLSLSQRFEIILTRLESNSAIFARKKRPEDE
jgi:hypothetical protein